MVRTFIAVDIDDPVLAGKLASIRDALYSTGVPMKPVETENLHLTIRFIGEIPEARVQDIIREALEPIDMKPFKAHLVGLGGFPNPYRPRVVWVGVQEGAEEFALLHKMIESGLRRIGLKPDKEEFHPHVTLARLKGTRNLERLVKLMITYRDYEFGWMTVDKVRLKKSTLTRRGPIYETLYEKRLV